MGDRGSGKKRTYHGSNRDVLGLGERDEADGVGALNRWEDDPEEEASESGTSELSSNVAQTLQRGGLASDDGSESNGRVEVGTGYIGKGVNESNRGETYTKGTDYRIDNLSISLGTFKVQGVGQINKDEQCGTQQLTQDRLSS